MAAQILLWLSAWSPTAPFAPPASRSRPLVASVEDAEQALGSAAASSVQTTVPVPFLPLTEQEIVDKLNAVPVFSVVNRERQMVPQPAGEAGELACTFYLDLEEAANALQRLEEANPQVALQLAPTPLGTAFALCEWQRGEADGGGADGAAATPVGLRLQASQSEVASVAEVLASTPAPPLLKRRDGQQGALPLFGSDALRFRASAAEGAADADGDGGADGGGTLLPLFLRRSDLRAAWLASGGGDADMPEVQVTDLRTLAWQMQVDGAQDWRPLLFVAPQPSIDYVQRAQENADDDGDAPPLTRNDVMGLLFPQADAGTPNAL